MQKHLQSVSAYVILMAAIVAALTWTTPAKIAGLFVVSGLAVGSLYALGGIGLVVLYRATGVLNLGAGAVGAFSVMLAWQLGVWGWPALLTWLAAIVVATGLSLVYGRLIAPRLAWRDPVVKAVATLGLALIVLGATAFLWEDDVRKFSLPTDEAAVTLLGLRVTVTRLIVVVAAVAIVIGMSCFLAWTRVGLQMRSLANDRDLSALLGVPILRVETQAWGIAGAIAGFTGLMFGDLVRLEPTIITFLVIPCVAAAVCGRLQSLGLVLVGGLSIGVIESLMTLSPTFKSVRSMAPFVIAALVLMWMQRGRRPLFAGDQ